jgi:hypothetical protein
MIPTKKEDVRIESTIAGETIRMRIDEEATEHIISLLTDLYSDPEQAIIREVCINALDSHREAGQTRPIEVTTPSPLSPVYTVQDWGIGLDAEGFRNIYSLYGKSTKTTTNEQTGSLGLGCKSPLTYTNQFTVVGVKDGVKTSAMISRDEDGIPTIEIVDETPTDEPNGAKVVIAVKRLNELERKARAFFKYWPEGTVLLNGEEPERLDMTDALKVNDRSYFFKHNTGTYRRTTDNVVVMGNVAYPINDEYLTDLDLRYYQGVIFFVEMGDVHFTPSREALNYTARTRRVLAELVEQFNKDLVDAAQAQVEAAATRHEAVRIALDWKQHLPGPAAAMLSMSWHGEEMPTTVDAPADHPFQVTTGHGSYCMGKAAMHKVIYLNAVPDALWVYGFNRNHTPTCKKKLWAYCDAHNLERPQQFILSSKRVRSKWIDKDRQIDWALVEKIKLPQKGRNGGAVRLAGSYDIYGPHVKAMPETPADEIDGSLPIFYADSDSEARSWAKRLTRLDVFDDFYVVVLYSNRVARFCRMFPHAKRAYQEFNEIFNTFWDFVDNTVKTAIAIRREDNDFRLLRMHEVHDPELRQAIMASQLDTSHVDAILELFDNRAMPSVNWTNPLKKYPLFEAETWRVGGRINEAELRRHNTLYVNAAYKELYANA